MKHILIIRFSSIGDIVLCSPVLRNLKNKFPDSKIDVLTKKEFAFVWEGNPHIENILIWGVPQDSKTWKQTSYDVIFDLHNNLRSLQVKMLRWDCPSITLDKQNFRKLLLVATKKTLLKITPIVDRYSNMLRILGIEDDRQGLDFFGLQEFEADKILPSGFNQLPKSYYALALGGSFATKQIPLKTYLKFFKETEHEVPFVLLGGGADTHLAESLEREFPDCFINLCGKLTLGQSAWVVKNAAVLISGDTGLAHIGAALGVNILWIWGSTTPQLGMMSPCKPEMGELISMEVLGLSCRPCSKLGHHKCPKKHFKCMDHNSVLWRENLEKLSASALG